LHGFETFVLYITGMVVVLAKVFGIITTAPFGALLNGVSVRWVMICGRWSIKNSPGNVLGVPGRNIAILG
jgi:hypothetical protein